ncbi:MAG: hypothetical protein IKT39_03225 [Clostridia bacterium]|nr:hypothetical protein [Clostridia bacterium]
MGLFNQNYDKPGKGVRKNEPKKKGAALYWELFSRKWRSYIVLNLLYAITCIPAFIIYFFIAFGLMPGHSPAEDTGLALMIAGFMITFFATSPFKAGYTYVLRNYVREQHAWTTSDFFEATRKNFGQATLMFVIDMVVSICFLFAIRFYFALSQTAIWVSVFLGLVIIAMVMFAIMQSFSWCMLVTFELKTKAIYKNSYLLSMATIPVNIASLFIRVAATALIFSFLPLALLAMVVVFLSAAGLLEQMLAYPAIDKFMMPKEDEEEKKEDYVDLDEIELQQNPEGTDD